jgi:hypothetical protein
MTTETAPAEQIQAHVAALAPLSDREILEKLAAVPPLADETDPSWDDPNYWSDTAYLYIALGDLAAMRKLKPAAHLLLERACYGDPGEIMRGLRHHLEAIFNPSWEELADVALAQAHSPRRGTRLWSICQLSVLDDPRARPIFEAALAEDDEIAMYAEIGLERLATS